MKKINNAILALILLAIIVSFLPIDFANSKYAELNSLKTPGEIVSNDFKNQNKKVIFWDIDLMEDGFTKLCTASEWRKGDIQEIKYYNNNFLNN